MGKYDNINKTLKKYGQKSVSDLINIVGVKTGALRDSITEFVNKDESLIIKMLDYGEYITPWSKGNGSQNYMQVFDKLEPGFMSELGEGYAEDLADQIANNAKKLPNTKVKTK